MYKLCDLRFAITECFQIPVVPVIGVGYMPLS